MSDRDKEVLGLRETPMTVTEVVSLLQEFPEEVVSTFPRVLKTQSWRDLYL